MLPGALGKLQDLDYVATEMSKGVRPDAAHMDERDKNAMTVTGQFVRNVGLGALNPYGLTGDVAASLPDTSKDVGDFFDAAARGDVKEMKDSGINIGLTAAGIGLGHAIGKVAQGAMRNADEVAGAAKPLGEGAEAATNTTMMWLPAWSAK